MDGKSALVITSIAGPGPVLHAYAAGCRATAARFILIGDRSSPAAFDLPGCTFHGIEDQLAMHWALARLLPERHYARKNLGYLEAIRGGATVIVETDDDNIPNAEFWSGRGPVVDARYVEQAGWVNAYRYFTEDPIWPRGLPLDLIRNGMPATSGPLPVHCPIQQGLADGDPDVDAIYRLTGELPVHFQRPAHPLALGPGSWCPINSQNTTWFQEVFPLLYLPSYCSFRMTDIWRGFIAQRIAHVNGWSVLFHHATVVQERNEHDLMKDFGQEVVGYMNNSAIRVALEEVVLTPGAEFMGANMKRCYERLVQMGLLEERELVLLDAWLNDLAKAAP
ncbi:MAG: DUF288 domain-containing protein [Flavobacteriales bacterium]|nr:DUF288 domain-containing protein [Flavobacteriales bacterium]